MDSVRPNPGVAPAIPPHVTITVEETPQSVADLQFLPPVSDLYLDLSLPREELLAAQKRYIQMLDQALAFLATEDPRHPGDLQNKSLPSRSCCSLRAPQSKVCDLTIYLLQNAPRVIANGLCCMPKCESKNPIRRPIPESAYRTLKSTETDFQRNSFGLFVIAPATIIAAPLIQAGAAVTAALTMTANFVITAVAGVFTYVGSGDIAAVRNGSGRRIVQGGIRVDAVQEAKTAYQLIAKHLDEKWRAASSDPDQRKIIELCEKIQRNWADIYHGIGDCGIKAESVKTILSPLSLRIVSILYPDLVTRGVMLAKEGGGAGVDDFLPTPPADSRAGKPASEGKEE